MINNELAEKLDVIANAENKTVYQLIKELIQERVKEEERAEKAKLIISHSVKDTTDGENKRLPAPSIGLTFRAFYPSLEEAEAIVNQRDNITQAKSKIRVP